MIPSQRKSNSVLSQKGNKSFHELQFCSGVLDWHITHFSFPSPLLFKEAVLQVHLAININTETREGNPC